MLGEVQRDPSLFLLRSLHAPFVYVVVSAECEELVVNLLGKEIFATTLLVF